MTAKQAAGIYLALLMIVTSDALAQKTNRPLVLQEMSWVEVRDYLKINDMVIIPLGSTEQHGPHLPLGSDHYEALEMSKRISAQSGVLVAPLLFVGYSVYHAGFPGTLSLKPETMAQVLFESAQMLRKHGFRRFLFFNYHGGNNVVQQNVIQRINHETDALAIAIGLDSPFQKREEGEFFDWHGGVRETSVMLLLKPELVKLRRAEKPTIRFSPRMEAIKKMSEKHPELIHLLHTLVGTPAETGKRGASHEISSNGVWSFRHPREATAGAGKQEVDNLVQTAVGFIRAWKRLDR